jgi:ketosteroid isomerase-like protein
MTQPSDPLAAEQQFFAALLAADTKALDDVLADDFLLVDVMSGSEIDKPALIAVVESGQLVFETIEPAETRVRHYGSTAVANGRTRMSGRYAGSPFTAASRYTHVYVEGAGRWRMVSAQGTPIA